MIIAFQILLLLIIPLSFITMFGNPERKEQLGAICITSMVAFCISIIWFD